MKLRRSVPAIVIWVVFLLFEIVMVASSGYFSELFPFENRLVYSIAFTVISILIIQLLTFLFGKLCDNLDTVSLKENVGIHALYALIGGAIIIGGVVFRVYLLGECVGDITGKMSLYENAMISGESFTPEYDLLSNAYSFILRLILFFTGNVISVPFYFPVACFTVFMICCFFTVKMLLGWAASIVFTAYVAFMPVFTSIFTGLSLSTDYLFMGMFGIELLFVALFLRKAYRGGYKSKGWVVWFLFVGAIVGFMAYVDAGTIIMILPFILVTFFVYGREFKENIFAVLFILLGAVLAFAGMLIQQQGFMMADVSLKTWATYYFHNLNTFSMFWTYTDHKIIYLVTVVTMSGVIVGFWHNRNFERISPWLWSMIFIFATVPFMGATRMNTQAFVTVYYAFILGCVASLITTPSFEEADYIEPDVFEELIGPVDASYEEVHEDEAKEPEEESRVIRPEKPSEYEFEDEPHFVPEGMVLPTDDDDETPHMKMPEVKIPTDSEGKPMKLKINRPEAEAKEAPKSPAPKKYDFDIEFKPGDDFDI